jgi:hypothetical protein
MFYKRELTQVREELRYEKSRVVIGGDIFEAQRNQLILNQTMEVEYLTQIDQLTAEITRLRSERDQFEKLFEDAHGRLGKAEAENKDALRRILGRLKGADDQAAYGAEMGKPLRAAIEVCEGALAGRPKLDTTRTWKRAKEFHGETS